MRIFGITGWSGAGKTTLIERLVAELSGRGVSVSTIKHSHHDVEPDPPGKDSFRHRAAGAREVALAGPSRLILVREHRGPEPDLAGVLSRLAPVDLVLVEGWKRGPHPKLEVWRAATGKPLLSAGDPTIRAIAFAGAKPEGAEVPLLDLDDTAGIADLVLREADTRA